MMKPLTRPSKTVFIVGKTRVTVIYEWDERNTDALGFCNKR